VAVYHSVFRDVKLVYCVSFLVPDFLQDFGKLHAGQIQGDILVIYARAFQGVGLEGAVDSKASLSSVTSPETTGLGFLGACTLSTRRVLIWKSPTVFWERLQRNLVFYARVLLA